MKKIAHFLLSCAAILISPYHLQAADEKIDPIPLAGSIELPKLPPELSNASGKVSLIAAVGPDGKAASVDIISSSDERLNGPSVDAIKSWEFVPGTSNGAPTISLYRQTFRFDDGQNLFDEKLLKLMTEAANETKETASKKVTSEKSKARPVKSPQVAKSKERTKSSKSTRTKTPQPVAKPEPVVIPDSPAIATKREEPSLPSELRNINGKVNVRFEISDEGRVKNAIAEDFSHKELVEPALAAAKRWRFKPAIKEGRPQESATVLPFIFSSPLIGKIDLATIRDADANQIQSKPLAVAQPLPETPAKFKNENGKVDTTIVVDEFGYVAYAKVEKASHPELGERVLQSLYQWKFKPGLQNGRGTLCKTRQSFTFTNGKGSIDKEELDALPEIVSSPRPKLKSSLAKLNGYVLMHMRIDRAGNVIEARVMESTNEKLEKPTIEASMGWKFKPGEKRGLPVESTIVIPFFYPHTNAG